MMKRHYQGLSDEQLREEVATLEQQLEDAKEVLGTRKGITLYRCAECGKTDADDDVIYEHLISDHRYPDEDASYSVDRIFA